MPFAERINDPPVYHYPHIEWDVISADLADTVTKKRGKPSYYQCPISFDIETTSFYSGQLEKAATMYAWALSIQGFVIVGRKWEQFQSVYEKLIDLFEPDTNNRIIIYVHNLSYEFQFICKHFEWEKVFALKERKPIYALTVDGIEFRCSYILSGYKLEKIGQDLHKYPIQKLVGALDYNLPRHSETPLSSEELQYLVNDVQIVVAYIQELIEQDGGIHKIPLTKTGYVRNYCRNATLRGNKRYRDFISHLTLNEQEYKQLKRAFAGGYTHGNWTRVGRVWDNMDSYDFTSSYPAVMVAEKFPMSPPQEVFPANWNEFTEYLKSYCVLFDAIFTNIDGWDAPDHIISKSKCFTLSSDARINNGRVIQASRLGITMTEVDYESIRYFYKWEQIDVSNVRIFSKRYLPQKFVESILHLYKDKTELKGVKGKEVEYLKSKEMINAAYGMTVTDIIRADNTYTDTWTVTKGDTTQQIEKYNKNKNRFLYYPWGVWVTAYARRNLFTAILEFGSDYVYADTDSIKAINADKHQTYIENYNKAIEEKMRKACEYHFIDFELTRPKTKKGIVKPLGAWDFDGHYDRFKTLGAKRYMWQDGNEVSLTVSGLRKETTVPYMKKIAKKQKKDIFDIFDDELVVPGEFTGKLTHTYIDYEISSYLEDYLGNIAEVHELSCLHLEPSPYALSIDKEFAELISGYTWEVDD